MSRLVKYTPIIAFTLIALSPKLAAATTAIYGDKQWEIDSTHTYTSRSAIIRNDFEFKSTAMHFIFGTDNSLSSSTSSPETITQVEQIESQINQLPISAELTIENGWATHFVPDQNGQSLDTYRLIKLLAQGSQSINLPVVVSEPEIKLKDLNNLGINELVATGESDFTGSTKNRIINVSVGASKYNGLIIQPGQEFSFNEFLGDVDAEHGFKPELVIKASGVAAEFGGGLCQVSSTMFRAAMNAGMPITERRNHSFAVHYYYPQGTDATIYPGSADLKFVNDYSSPVLVRTYIEGVHLYFQMYGTKDNRVVTFEGPVQYDKKSDGSLKATWTRHVTKNGETTTYVAKSNYLPPALFEKVDQTTTTNPQAVATPANTAPAAATPTT